MTEFLESEEQKMFKKIKEWFIWLFSKKVDEAINNGATYTEVLDIVQEEMKK